MRLRRWLRRLGFGSKRRKVFGIGFHKTGTSSLRAALKLAGYRVAGPNFVTAPDIAETVHTRALKLCRRYDGFQDNPWPLLYEFLDRELPGSKFILTVRDPDGWIGSIQRHFGGGSTPMREWIYGTGRGDPTGNEEVYLRRYLDHNRAVRKYFAGRTDDFLVLDIIGGEGWSRLAPFLGVTAPSEPFPHRNAYWMREQTP